MKKHHLRGFGNKNHYLGDVKASMKKDVMIMTFCELAGKVLPMQS